MGKVPELTFDWRLKMACAQADMTQAELAEKLGVNAATISRWISGDSRPRRHQIMACAMATGVPFTWLETGKAPADKPEPSDMARPEGFEPPTS
ncbi:hypothetical protein HMPREF9306_00200 [Propionimicrobium lymphophilum ACS-093-V-SCH5]|uniref:HTH cro/C1-type domain-containing protein n=2 Tax=Propionimicrobium TaxID=203133 RepID=S2W3R5_9ACTN|nr:hypothetical protein HMPREF9306_00200 [Propionimicrobium lymphophilum ACS-093-V-SCH5]